jgi:hypothetical protein
LSKKIKRQDSKLQMFKNNIQENIRTLEGKSRQCGIPHNKVLAAVDIQATQYR